MHNKESWNVIYCKQIAFASYFRSCYDFLSVEPYPASITIIDITMPCTSWGTCADRFATIEQHIHLIQLEITLKYYAFLKHYCWFYHLYCLSSICIAYNTMPCTCRGLRQAPAQIASHHRTTHPPHSGRASRPHCERWRVREYLLVWAAVRRIYVVFK